MRFIWLWEVLVIYQELVGKMAITREESSLILDYFFRRSEQEQIDRGSDLISSNSQAAKFYSYVKQTLARFEHMKGEKCPDELVHLTIARLKLAITKKPSTPQK